MQAKVSDFYDAQWQGWDDMARYSPAPRIRRHRTLSWLKKRPFGTLLDIGCGNGEFLLEALLAFPGVGLAGYDVSPQVIEKNRNASPKVEYKVFDLERDSFDQTFEAVVCMEVVEHCSDYVAAIRRLAEMTEKYLVITVPCGPLFPIDKMVGHTRHFTPKDIADAVEKAGLTVERVEAWGFPFFNLYKHLINLSPEKTSQAFMSEQKYTDFQKLVSRLVYICFRLSLPFAGYQLFAFCRR